MTKVKTSFKNLKDADFDGLGAAIVISLTGNPHFSFTTELTKAKAASDDFQDKMSSLNVGGPIAVAAKKESRIVLAKALRTLGLSVNLQANGDEMKLKTTAFPLVKKAVSEKMPQPVGLMVRQHPVSGSVYVKVNVPHLKDHGTLFAYKTLDNPETNPENWKWKHANGHSLIISGLQRGKEYYFSAAYKGRDEDVLAWCPAIEKMVV